MPLKHPIIADIVGNHRDFLPGKPCNPDQVLQHFKDNILFDGLNREESELILSSLPMDSSRIYVRPLDKGLSGSIVLAGRYERIGYPISKPFVFKIGRLDKIEREYGAIEQYVRPYIQGIEKPIFRRSRNIGLIIQSIAGLGRDSELKNLKEYVRTDRPEIITRLLRERLGPWYGGMQGYLPITEHSLDDTFKRYLAKMNGADPFPAEWDELKNWVETLTGFPWGDVPTAITALRGAKITSPSCIVHGDLHSQNILVDERGECWPIDFYWCHNHSTPLVDLTMLECSLKFLAIHQRSDLRSLIKIETAFSQEPVPNIIIGNIPYSFEIRNVIRSILALRSYAFDSMKLKFEDYRKVLCLMTYVHSTHPLLNRPYVLASLQILSALAEKTT